MAQDLTQATQLAAQAQEKRPNIVLKIDGIDLVFGASVVKKAARYGEDDIVFGQAGLLYGGSIIDVNSRDYISLEGSSSSITQQLKQDKGSVSSIANIKIKLIDFGRELSEIFTPGNTIDDLLARQAEVFFMFDGTSFPEDAISIFNGIIVDYDADAASFDLKIAHPDQLKRQEIFTIVQKELASNINDSVTTITLDGTGDMVKPATDFRTFITVGDEIIEYTGISGNDLTGCVRGSLNTIAATHDAGDETETFYELSGKGIEIALRTMLSDPDQEFINDAPLSATRHEQSSSNSYDTVFFEGLFLETSLGIVLGDRLTGTSTDNFGNVFVIVDDLIVSIREDDTGTRFTLASGFGKSAAQDYNFTSKYNVWPIGLSMRPVQVDITEHERIEDLFGAGFPEMRLYVKEGIQGKELIEKDLMFPNGLYTIPRKGRSSLGITVPPLAEFGTQTLDETNVIQPDKIKIGRSVNRDFYNAVVYKFDEDSLEDKALKGLQVLSQNSINRIKFKNKPLVVNAKGFRPGNGTEDLIRRQANKFLARYQFAADSLSNVQVSFGTGFNIDVGDRVIFGSPALQIFDSKQSGRDFAPRVMEVVNKKLDFKGRVFLDLLDTGFTTRARYGTVAPSSKIDSYASGELKLKVSFTTNPADGEAQKWTRYIEEKMLIHNEDYSVQETVQIIGISDTDANSLEVTEPTITVTSDMVADLANYAQAGSKSKSIHTFFGPVLDVTGGTSGTEFTVSDASRAYVGAVLIVYSTDYSQISKEAIIESISGNTITTATDLGFTPSAGQGVNLIGFDSDNGLPYRLF